MEGDGKTFPRAREGAVLWHMHSPMGMLRFAGKASGLEGSNKLKEEVG